MTVSRKTGRRYERKMQRLLTETFPHMTAAELTAITTRVMGSKAFVQQALCAVATEDLDSYPEADLYPDRSDKRLVTRLGWCGIHGVFHRYSRRALTELIVAERDGALEQVRALDSTVKLPLDLWDMLYNRATGYLTTLVTAHDQDLTHARQVIGQKHREILAARYESLPLEKRLDFYMCGRKSPRATFQEAEASLHALPASTPGLATLIVYQCDWCDMYHLGHHDKHNDYTGATDEQMDTYASYTWYNSFQSAKRYAVRQHWDLSVTISHDDLVNWDPQTASKIFQSR